jgi:CheY-like chemotaxis protein
LDVLHPPHILLIEDNADIREAMAIVLSSEGYSVTETADGSLGLEALLAQGPFDVIVLDLVMPVMDGGTFLDRKSNCAFAEVPVVICSSTMPSVQLVGYAGVVSVVTKLDGPAALLGAVAHARIRRNDLAIIPKAGGLPPGTSPDVSKHL